MLARVSHHWLHFWDRATGRQMTKYRAYEGEFIRIYPPSLAFAPDGETFALGGRDGPVMLRDAGDGRVKAILKGHGEAVLHVAWTTDGETLISADRGGMVRSWEIATGREQAAINSREGAPRGVNLSPDDRFIAIQVKDIHVWDVSTGELRATIASGPRNASGPRFPGHFAFSPDGKSLTTVDWDGALRTWDVTTGALKLMSRVDSLIEQVAFSPSGDKLVMSCQDATIRLWEWRPSNR